MSVGNVDKTTGDAHKNAGNMFDKVGNLTALHTTAKSDAVAAINEVADEAAELESKKADTDMVAADFNAGTSYTAGNYCVKDGKLYKFKNNHSGAWSSADVDEVKITGELSALKSGLTNLDFTDYGAIDTASNFSARLSKVSNIAFLFVGDFVSLSAGETVLTGKIPVGYRPVLDVNFTLIQRNVSPRILAFSVKPDGNISLYNYGAEISSATAFADTLAWPIGS